MQTFLKKYLSLFAVVCILISVFSINTFATGSSSLVSDRKELRVDETINVTARFCSYSYQPIYKIEGYITYDPYVIEFVSGENCSKLTDGKIKVILYSDGTLICTEQIQFKAVSPGLTTVALENLAYYDANNVRRSLDGKDISITVINSDKSASANANLKSLRVSAGTLVPAFSPNVTAYNVVIPNDKEELLISVSTDASKATYVVEGSKMMKVGENRRTVVVTAENGAQKAYTVNIVRLDELGKVPTHTGKLEQNLRIEVKVGDQNMYVAQELSNVVVPTGFRANTYAYDGNLVPCITDNKVVMLYLVNSQTGDAGFYIVSDKNDFVKLTTLRVGKDDYHILPYKGKKIPNGYTESTVIIDGMEIPAYKSTDISVADVILVYAKGPSGLVDFYRYDIMEETMQRSLGMGLTFGDPVKQNDKSGEFLNVIKNLTPNGIIVLTITAAIILILLFVIAFLIVRIISTDRNKFIVDEEVDETDFIGFTSIADEKEENK